MDGLFPESTDRVHDSLIRSEYPEEQDGEGRQDCEEVSQEYSRIAIQALDHQENRGAIMSSSTIPNRTSIIVI